jgi:hypothetical protein
MRKLKIVKKIVSTDIKDVYDIEVDTEHHYILNNGVISHNSGPIYAASIVIAMKKMKLKEDEDGNKTSEVMGIRAGCKVVKTRYNKPFEDIQVKIPYATGMDPYSGLFDLFEKSGVIAKEGNRYKYISPADNTEIKEFRKNWSHEQFNKVMKEWNLIDRNTLKENSNVADIESHGK